MLQAELPQKHYLLGSLLGLLKLLLVLLGIALELTLGLIELLRLLPRGNTEHILILLRINRTAKHNSSEFKGYLRVKYGLESHLVAPSQKDIGDVEQEGADRSNADATDEQGKGAFSLGCAIRWFTRSMDFPNNSFLITAPDCITWS